MKQNPQWPINRRIECKPPNIARSVIKTKWHHVISIRLAIVKKSGSTTCYHILARETVEVWIGPITWEGILGTLVKLKIYIPYSPVGKVAQDLLWSHTASWYKVLEQQQKSYLCDVWTPAQQLNSTELINTKFRLFISRWVGGRWWKDKGCQLYLCFCFPWKKWKIWSKYWELLRLDRAGLVGVH